MAMEYIKVSGFSPTLTDLPTFKQEELSDALDSLDWIPIRDFLVYPVRLYGEEIRQGILVCPISDSTQVDFQCTQFVQFENPIILDIYVKALKSTGFIDREFIGRMYDISANSVNLTALQELINDIFAEYPQLEPEFKVYRDVEKEPLVIGLFEQENALARYLLFLIEENASIRGEDIDIFAQKLQYLGQEFLFFDIDKLFPVYAERSFSLGYYNSLLVIRGRHSIELVMVNKANAASLKEIIEIMSKSELYSLKRPEIGEINVILDDANLDIVPVIFKGQFCILINRAVNATRRGKFKQALERLIRSVDPDFDSEPYTKDWGTGPNPRVSLVPFPFLKNLTSKS